jgi:hypothetical protein
MSRFPFRFPIRWKILPSFSSEGGRLFASPEFLCSQNDTEPTFLCLPGLFNTDPSPASFLNPQAGLHLDFS